MHSIPRPSPRAFGWLLCASLAGMAAQGSASAAVLPCESLRNIDFNFIPEAGTQTVLVQSVAASSAGGGGDYQPQALSGTPLAGTELRAATDLSAYCRYVGNIAPQIHFELRLPVNWNKKLLMQGCGGMCGTINIEAAEDALIPGYAVALLKRRS